MNPLLKWMLNKIQLLLEYLYNKVLPPGELPVPRLSVNSYAGFGGQNFSVCIWSRLDWKHEDNWEITVYHDIYVLTLNFSAVEKPRFNVHNMVKK